MNDLTAPNNSLVPQATYQIEERDINWWNDFLQRRYYGVDKHEWDTAVDAICSDAGLSEGAHVLELGSGSGQIISRLAQRGMHAVGVERSPDLVLACRTHAAAIGADTAEYIEHDMFTYQPTLLFDCILSVNTSFGFGTREQNLQLIDAIGTWLKPGGVFFLDVCTADAAADYGTWHAKVDGGKLTVASSYDTATQVFKNLPSWLSPDGRVRYDAFEPETLYLYTISEFEQRMRNAGMEPNRLKRSMGRWFDQTEDQMQTTWVARKVSEKMDELGQHRDSVTLVP